MAELLSAPAPSMNWEANNLPEAWKKFQQLAELTFSGPLKNKSEVEKISYLLIWVGEKGRDIYNTWSDLNENNRNLLVSYYDRFKAYVTPKSNTVFARYKFHNRIQEADDTFDSFVTDLKLLVKDCGYDKPGEMVRDRVVFGIQSAKVREKLLQKGSELTLEKTIEIAHAFELSESQLRTMSGQEPSQVHTVKRVSNKGPEKWIKNCFFCGHDHKKGHCPAWGTTCDKCGLKNHWKKQCETVAQHARGHRSRSRGRHTRFHRGQMRGGGNRNVRSVNKSADGDELFIQTVHQKSIGKIKNNHNQLQAVLEIKNSKQKLLAQIDTGAEANILPMRCFKQISPVPESKCTPWITLSGYDGNAINHHGVVKLQCSVNNEGWRNIPFYVCDTDGPIILGLEDSYALKLININRSHVKHVTVSVVSKKTKSVNTSQNASEPSVYLYIKDTDSLKAAYPDRFEGIGNFTNKAHFQLKDDAVPVVHAPRRCPVHLRSEINDAITNMEEKGIIEKIPSGQPTEWLSSLAYARKANGKLRVCLDPRDLNENIKRTHHRAPTVEEITFKLADARIFSKLDAKDGYWSIALDDESSNLTAFNSPASNQRYRFKRLPFGINVSQDLFQEAMDEITRNLKGVISIADDVCVFGKDEADHDRNMHNLMLRARDHGLVFNPNKCFVKVPEITFFGSVYSRNGVRPDEKRTKEINDLPSPSNKQKVQSFLGMVQYLSPYIPHLSELTLPLRDLVKKDSDFVWTATHQNAFEKLKSAVTNATTLSYFNPQHQTKVQVDASKVGLGAALIQIDPADPHRERVVAFASKSLSDVESRYANIERECLAVVFGVEKFHTYVYNSKVIVESDHKPLEAILKKNLAQAPPRLQRMMLRLQAYDIDIKYRKGSELLLADFLSRYQPNTAEKHIEMENTIHSVRWSDEKLKILRETTSTDLTLSSLYKVVTSGWPEKCSDLPKVLKPYWSIKDYISIEDGILLKGQQVIVPELMREDVLNQLHEHCHQGIEKTQLLARQCVYWPNINNDICEMVGKCTACNTHKNSQPHEPMYERDIPCRPWDMLGTDLFDFQGDKYLLLCDYYSKFFVVRKLSNESSYSVIKHMKQIFTEHGIPQKLFSDNGRCYSSFEFQQFMKDYGINHTTSSPHYSQSNGFVERMVGVVKGTMKKCAMVKEDPELAFLFLRATPLNSHLPSPAELLYNRPIRSMLPLHMKESDKHERVKEILKKQQQSQKHYYDRHSHELKPLKSGDTVMLQSEDRDHKWQPATVVSPLKEPRSYLVQTNNGSRYRRNRKFLREIAPNVTFQKEIGESDGINEETAEVQEQPQSSNKQITITDLPSIHTYDQPQPTRVSSRTRKGPTRLIEEI